ncbi:MAG: M15 family metallopeptidase [Patescibacteria group bacterium]
MFELISNKERRKSTTKIELIQEAAACYNSLHMDKASHRNIDWPLWALIASTAVLFIATGWLGYQNHLMKAEIAALTASSTIQITQLSQRLAEADFMITDLQEKLGLTEEELEELEEDYEREREKNERFEDQIRDISGTVNDLDKLSKTDEELLQKYSSVSFLNENYVPSDLDKIRSRYVAEDRDDQYFHGDAMKFLVDMIQDAEDDNIELKVASAYRSFEEQNAIKGAFTRIYGEGANQFSADQGFSEHQLGTTVDFTTPEVVCICAAFGDTEAYQWLLDNAHDYGFTLSYPQGNQFFIFEPWHWRFVGRDLARDLERDNASFYDWEQREIDEYLIKIFD